MAVDLGTSYYYLRWFIASPSLKLVTSLAVVLAITAYRVRQVAKERARHSAETHEPDLLRQHSSFQTYETSAGHVYRGIRTFYHSHSKADKLPKLPLLVYMHGLGGSTAQFSLLLNSLVCIAPCLSIDLPGCGRSDIDTSMPSNAFSTGNLAQLLATAIERFRDRDSSQEVILIGHSLGCSISASLVSTHSPLHEELRFKIAGFAAICPRASSLTSKQLRALARLRHVPAWLFDCVRLLDRIGGINAKNVIRFVGEAVDEETKKTQIRFNEQSRSETLIAMLLSWAPSDKTDSRLASFLSREIWECINVPLYLIAARDDQVTLPLEAQDIATWLIEHRAPNEQERTEGFTQLLREEIVSIEALGKPTSQNTKPTRSQTPTWTNARLLGASQLATTNTENPSNAQPTTTPTPNTTPTAPIHLTTIPSPASHGLIYTPSTAHTVAGLLQNFLSSTITPHLSPSWQLQHLTTDSDKWEVKNYSKWSRVSPCSEPIADLFRAMKTMRNDDETHSPQTFAANFGPQSGVGKSVRVVLDISHEVPVYKPLGLVEGGVEYRKLPTVSKVPPTLEEVRAFNTVIDELRATYGVGENFTVAVHCHYGFNRTGMFIVCYLVEKLGWGLQEAIDEFAAKRPPGIKHVYFIDELFVRYGVKRDS